MKTTVSRSVLFERASASGQSILQFAPRSAGAAAYRALATEVLALGPLAPRSVPSARVSKGAKASKSAHAKTAKG
jgi:nitrogenase subunit NifH